MERLNKTLDMCTNVLTDEQKDETEQEEVELIEQEVETLTKSELEQQIDSVKMAINSKKAEIKKHFKNKFEDAVKDNHKYAITLKKGLERYESQLKKLEDQLSELNNTQGF